MASAAERDRIREGGRGRPRAHRVGVVLVGHLLEDDRTAELLEGVCDVDLDTLDVDPAAGLRPQLKVRRMTLPRRGSWRM